MLDALGERVRRLGGREIFVENTFGEPLKRGRKCSDGVGNQLRDRELAPGQEMAG